MKISARSAIRRPSFIVTAADGQVQTRASSRQRASATLLLERGGIMAWKAAGLPTRSKRNATGEGNRKRFWLF